MSNEDQSIAAFRAIAEQYAQELKKAERDLERAKKKVEAARTQLKVANDMISKVTQGDSADKSLIESIQELLAMVPDRQISAKAIHEGLQHEFGISAELVSVHTAADRAADRGLIGKTADGKKLYFYKPEPQEEPV